MPVLKRLPLVFLVLLAAAGVFTAGTVEYLAPGLNDQSPLASAIVRAPEVYVAQASETPQIPMYRAENSPEHPAPHSVLNADTHNVLFIENSIAEMLSADTGVRTRLAQHPNGIVDAQFSRKDGSLFWLTKDGELWRRTVAGEERALVSVANDMTVVEIEQGGEMDDAGKFIGAHTFTYLRGQVRRFYSSPTGNFIVYEALSGYTSCCMGHNDIPVYSLWSMHSDGSSKVAMLNQDHRRANFIGWLPDDAGIFYTLQDTDQFMTAAGFFKRSFDGLQDYHKEKYIIPIFEPYTSSFPGAEPVFSPHGSSVAFPSIVDDSVQLWIDDGVEEKTLLPKDSFQYFDPYSADIAWTKDAAFLVVRAGTTTSVFTGAGEQVRSFTLPEMPRLEPTLFTDDAAFMVSVLVYDGRQYIALVGLLAEYFHAYDISKAMGGDIGGNVWLESIASDKIFFSIRKEWRAREQEPLTSLWLLDSTTGEIRKISDDAKVVSRM